MTTNDEAQAGDYKVREETSINQFTGPAIVLAIAAVWVAIVALIGAVR